MLAEMQVRTSSAPGDFGTAIHATLEWFHKIVEDSPESYTLDMLLELWLTISNKYLGFENDYRDTGTDLLTGYLEQHPTPPIVVSQEIKESFPITTKDGTEIQVTYIIDRVDKVDGAYEIIDYKTQYGYVAPDNMREMIQPFLYACAIRRKYDVHRIPVTYIMLRQDPQNVTIVVTDADMDRTERYLCDIAQRILDDERPVERLNSECGFCIRKAVCGAWKNAAEAGWSPTMELGPMVSKYAEAKDAAKAAETLAEEIQKALLARLRQDKVYEAEVDGYEIKVKMSKRGKYDTQGVFGVLGESALPFMTVGKTALDGEMKRKRGNIFTDYEREKIAETLSVTTGEPKIEVVKVAPDEATD